MSTKITDREIRAFSVRIPDALYRESQQLAKRQKVSLNALMNQALAEVIEKARDQEMYDAATLLGNDAELSDVEFAIQAQSEAVFAHE